MPRRPPLFVSSYHAAGVALPRPTLQLSQAGCPRPAWLKFALNRLLIAFLFGFVGGIEGVLQRHQILARFQRIEHRLFGFELFR